jgi:cellulose synthase/poly-beta-1,6-N-acetylglucosamine synthase-like glycosyltransferase
MVVPGITLFLLLGYLLLIRYYYGHFKKLPHFSAIGSEPRTFVSVLIAARNEENTLPQLLHALALQSYPSEFFEVLVIDDFSTDATVAVVQTLRQAQDKLFSKPHIKIIQPNVEPQHSSKKRAIEAGVQHAKGPLLLITDADCIPGSDWIKTVVAFYEQKQALFIAAPVLFTQDGSLLQIFQALDFMTLQGITAASVGAQFHTMCNGANLAYTKAAFESVNGFAGIDHIASGDDMLLMHKIWLQQKDRVRYLKSSDAIVRTAPMPTWNAFVAQRRRWASKTTHYNDKRIFFVLLFVYLLNAWFIVLLIASFWKPAFLIYALAFLVLKTIIEWPFVSMVAKFYKEQKLMRYFFVMQPLHIFYTVVVGAISQLGRYEWKGRRTK